MDAMLRSDENEINFTISDMIGDDIITLIGLDAVLDYAEENGIEISNLYMFI